MPPSRTAQGVGCTVYGAIGFVRTCARVQMRAAAAAQASLSGNVP